MAAGDKLIINFANRDTMKYNPSVDYGAGSIVVYTDGNFYEANAKIDANTTWALGTTGATWKQIAKGFPVGWVQSSKYLAGDKVIKDKSVWEANADIPANTAFSKGTAGATWKIVVAGNTPAYSSSSVYSVGDRVHINGHEWECTTAITTGETFNPAKWNVVAGLLDGQAFNALNTLTATSGDLLAGDYLLPATTDNLNIGNLTYALASIYSQRYRFVVDGNYMGEIDADSGNLEINSSQKMQFKPSGATSTVFEMSSATARLNADFVIDNNHKLTFRDSDASSKEYWDMEMTGNDWKLTYNGTSTIGLLFDRLSSDTSKGIFQPIADNNNYLGSSGKKWIRVYATDGSINTSDKRLKDIHNDTIPVKLLESWAKYCKPAEWSWKEGNGTAGRKFGWLAQDVLKALKEAGLDWNDYSLIEKCEKGYYHICKDECQAVENAMIRYKLGL
ncbi:hypothetical protein KUA24_75 [Vibrio phage HNL01]|nr:hypothetical protein KUA24_75 [Vibrio phage HNL01]